MNKNGTQIGALALDLHDLSFLCALCVLCGLFSQETTRAERTTKNENRTQIGMSNMIFSFLCALCASAVYFQRSVFSPKLFGNAP
jgi:hypothetical protein